MESNHTAILITIMKIQTGLANNLPGGNGARATPKPGTTREYRRQIPSLEYLVGCKGNEGVRTVDGPLTPT